MREMKQISIMILAICALLTIAEATPKESYKVARGYIKECKSKDITPSLGNIIGWAEVEKYWQSVPTLKKLRDDFEEADKELQNILMMEEEYRLAQQKYIDAISVTERKESLAQLNEVKIRVFRRLNSESNEYRRARKKRDEALLESNIRTFEYILKDYEEKGKDFPIDWIEKQN